MYISMQMWNMSGHCAKNDRWFGLSFPSLFSSFSPGNRCGSFESPDGSPLSHLRPTLVIHPIYMISLSLSLNLSMPFSFPCTASPNLRKPFVRPSTPLPCERIFEKQVYLQLPAPRFYQQISGHFLIHRTGIPTHVFSTHHIQLT